MDPRALRTCANTTWVVSLPVASRVLLSCKDNPDASLGKASVLYHSVVKDRTKGIMCRHSRWVCSSIFRASHNTG